MFFSFPSCSRIEGMGFFNSLPVPELREWNYPFPFPFLNSQMSFPLTPGWEAVFGLMRHLCCTLENERLAEFVFVFVLLFVFVFIPLIRQVCCSSVSGLQSISWWVVGAHNVRWTTTQPPTGETTGLSRSHTVPTPPHWQNTTSVKKIFLGLSALAIEKQHCIIPLANSLKYLTFETAK